MEVPAPEDRSAISGLANGKASPHSNGIVCLISPRTIPGRRPLASTMRMDMMRRPGLVPNISKSTDIPNHAATSSNASPPAGHPTKPAETTKELANAQAAVTGRSIAVETIRRQIGAIGRSGLTEPDSKVVIDYLGIGMITRHAASHSADNETPRLTTGASSCSAERRGGRARPRDAAVTAGGGSITNEVLTMSIPRLFSTARPRWTRVWSLAALVAFGLIAVSLLPGSTSPVSAAPATQCNREQNGGGTQVACTVVVSNFVTGAGVQTALSTVVSTRCVGASGPVSTLT